MALMIIAIFSIHPSFPATHEGQYTSFKELAHKHMPRTFTPGRTSSTGGIDPRDLRLSNPWLLEDELDESQAGSGGALLNMDHQAGDRTACPPAHPCHHGSGRRTGVYRLQPGGRRHQRRPSQAAWCQEAPSAPALQGSAGISPGRSGVQHQPDGEARFRDARVDGLPLRRGPGNDLG